MSCSFRKDELVEICRADGKRIRTGLRQYPTVVTKQKKSDAKPLYFKPHRTAKRGEYATITKEPEQVQGKKAGSVVYFAWIVLTSRPQRIEGWINTAHLKKRDLVSAPLVGNNNIPSSVQTASCIKAATSDPPKKITNIVVKASRAAPPVPPPRPQITLRMDSASMSTLNSTPEYAPLKGVANSKLAFSGDTPTDILQLPNMQTEIGYSFDVERKVLEDNHKLQQAETASIVRAKRYAQFGDEYAEFAKILKLV